MTAAVSSGILSNNAIELANFCSTGNCTWPTVPTLAMCGECTDMTKTLSSTLNTTDGQNLTTYRLASGSSITGASEVQRASGSNGWLPIFSVSNTPGTVYKASDTDKGIRAYVANIDMIGSPFLSGYQTSGALANVTAHECALWWCVASYNISVHNGIQSVTTSTWSETQYSRDGDGVLNWWNFTNIPSSFNVQPGSWYGISYNAMLGIQASGLPFAGTISDSELGAEYNWTPQLEAVWQHSADPSAYLRNIALGMSNNVRLEQPSDQTYVFNQPPERNATFYNGQAYWTPAILWVRWIWLVFPVAVVLLSLAFFAITIVQTRRRSVRAWKSSPLALLFSDTDAEVRVRARGGMDWPGGLSEQIGETRVRLVRVGDRWTFRSA